MPPRRIFILLYGASGAATLVYEVVWTRLLTLQLGHTVAAASTSSRHSWADRVGQGRAA
ncbi:MAG TPA: hypothetical protein VFP91_07835 [Vicinamibacterales bacterium]|nr:hypothetical protein [Vicinamibacterales bacterium]